MSASAFDASLDRWRSKNFSDSRASRTGRAVHQCEFAREFLGSHDASTSWHSLDICRRAVCSLFWKKKTQFVTKSTFKNPNRLTCMTAHMYVQHVVCFERLQFATALWPSTNVRCLLVFVDVLVRNVPHKFKMIVKLARSTALPIATGLLVVWFLFCRIRDHNVAGV